MRIIGIFLFSILFNYCFAEDNLLLSGIVKGFKNNKVIIDVSSGSCHGEREFNIPFNINKDEIKTGKKIVFFINKSTCKGEDIQIIKIFKRELR